MQRLARGDRLVLATHNPGKCREIEALLAGSGVTLVSASALDLTAPKEDAADFAGNARIKARAATLRSGLPALADDSGFCVAGLDGAPGVHSARWAGPDQDYGRAFARIAALLAGSGDRRAWFCCVLCQAWPDGETVLFQGRVEGTLALPPRGSGGFGYDSVFVPLGETVRYAEMTPAQKHRTSHRAQALAAWRRAVLPSP